MVIGGAQTAQQLLKAGLADELRIGLVPVLLGDGLRFFDNISAEPIQLERIRVIESPGRTDLLCPQRSAACRRRKGAASAPSSRTCTRRG